MLFKIFIILFSLCVSLCICAVEYSDRGRNFSLELIYFTGQEKQNHFVVSPFSVWTLLTGLAYGTVGDTYREVRIALILPLKMSRTVEQYPGLMKAVFDTPKPEISVSTKSYMFYDNIVPVERDFMGMLEKDFKTVVNQITPDNWTATDVIVDDIKKSNTHAVNVLNLSNLQGAVTMRAINFISLEGRWGVPFDKRDTAVSNFYNDDGEVIGEVNMMHQKGPFQFTDIKELEAVLIDLPFANNAKYSMLVILPYDKRNTTAVYRKFLTYSIPDIYKSLKDDLEAYGEEIVDLKIPRFRITDEINMEKPLNSMGVYSLFEKSDFHRAVRLPVQISGFTQSVNIEITESGSVLGATTPKEQPIRSLISNIVVDRPFIFFVMEKSTLSILIGGIYSKPEKY